MKIQGECHPKFNKVEEVFSELYEENREIGSAFAIFKDGKQIVNIWAGHQNPQKNIYVKHAWRHRCAKVAPNGAKGLQNCSKSASQSQKIDEKGGSMTVALKMY